MTSQTQTTPGGAAGRPGTVRVLIADDQVLVRAGLRVLVDSAPDLEVVAEAATGLEAGALARSARADVVLMDIRMPELDGLEATRRIAADEDLAGVRVLILTTFEIDDHVFRALRAGAAGFLGKGAEPGELLDAIRVVARGDALLSPAATKGLIARFLAQPEPAAGPYPAGEQAAGDKAPAPERLGRLTDRERQVVALVATGAANDEIADRLAVSPLTVKTHVSRAMLKLGTRDRAQLVVLAYEAGLVRPGGAAAAP